MPPRRRNTTRRTTKRTKPCKRCKKITGTSLDAIIDGDDTTEVRHLRKVPKKKKESGFKKFMKTAGKAALIGLGGYAGYQALKKVTDRVATKQLNNANISKQDKINLGRIMAQKKAEAKAKWDKEKEEHNKNVSWWKIWDKKFGNKTDQELLGLKDDEMAGYNESMRMYEESVMDETAREVINTATSNLPHNPGALNPQSLAKAVNDMGKLVQRYNTVVYINDFQPQQEKVLDMCADWPKSPFDKAESEWQFLQQSLQGILYTYNEVMRRA